MRNFALEVFFSEWEFTAKHHMTASDMESLSIADLLAMGTDTQRQSFENLWLGYTETWGHPALRQAIARTYDTLSPENVLCLAGAGEGLYAFAKCFLNADDHVIVPTPNYQSAETVPLTVCEVTGIPLRREANAGKNTWHLDVDDLKVAIRPNTKLLSLNFPHNPTGMLPTHDQLTAIVNLCREHGITILSDEVYRGVEIEPSRQLPQIADIYENGISLNVLSKAYGLPGLRIGWLASQNRELLQKVERYKHYLSICNSAPSEALGLIAVENRETIFARNRALVAKNAELLEHLLSQYPGLIEWDRPQGGCVAFPKYIGRGSGEEFCKTLLQESGVLLLPASIYHSELNDVPVDHFRIGIGRNKVFKDGLGAMREHFEKYFSDFHA